MNANIPSIDLENFLTEEMLAAGTARLAEIGEASLAYLAKEAFLAMIAEGLAAGIFAVGTNVHEQPATSARRVQEADAGALLFYPGSC